MKRIIIPNAGTCLTAIEDAISQTRNIRYFHRLEVVRYVLQGHSPYEAAQIFNHSPRSIHNWLHRLASQGISGLQATPQTGRPPRLSQIDRQRLQQDLGHAPQELGYDQNLWDGILLSHHLAHKYSVTLGVRRCQNLFHELGLSLQRPRQQASEANSSQQAVFKKIFSANARPQRPAMV
jgi:transposase